MSILSLLEDYRNNPPEEEVLPTAGTDLTGQARPDVASIARDQALINMASIEEEDNAPSLGDRYSEANLNYSLIQQVKTRLLEEDRLRRRDQAVPLESAILSSGMSTTASYETITDLRKEIDEGASLENIAVRELVADNMAEAYARNQEDLAMEQGMGYIHRMEVNKMLSDLSDRTERGFASSPFLPGVETTFETLGSWLLFPKSSGTNLTGVLDAMTGKNHGLLEAMLPGNHLIEAQNILHRMTLEEQAAAIKRAERYIINNAGIITDNIEDMRAMVAIVQAAFGTRVQAQAAKVAGTTGMIIDFLLTATAFSAAKLAVRGVRNAGTLSVKQLTKGLGATAIPAADDVVKTVARKAKGKAKGTAENAAEGVAQDMIVPPSTIGDDLARLRDKIDLDDPVDFDVGPVTIMASKKSDDGKTLLGPTVEENAARRGKTGLPANSPAQIVNAVNPRRAAPILSEAITNVDGSVAAGVGATRSQVVDEAVAPRVLGDPIRRGASLIMPKANSSISDIDLRLAQLSYDGKIYTPEELEKVKKDIGEVDTNLVSNESHLVNKSEAFVNEDTGEVSMNYVFDAGEQRSFSTAGEARAFITKLPPTRIDNPTVLKYDADQNAYVPFDGDSDEVGEFLLQATYKREASSGAAKEKVLTADSANFLANNVDTSVSYIDRMSQGISRLDIRKAKVAKIFTEILKPLAALRSKADLDAVWGALKEAELNIEDFTQAELSIKMEGNQARISAYRAVRKFNQTLYEIRNGQYRKFLSKKGYLTHTHNDGVDAWVKPIQDSDEVVTVWWDEAGAIVSKQTLLDEGIELDILEGFKPRRAYAEADGSLMETSYTAVRKGKTALQPLPVQVLTNKKTYLSRHLETKYVIEKTEKAMVNGRLENVTKVVAVSNNPTDALKHSLTDDSFTFRRAREVTNVSDELDQMFDYQMLTNTKNRMEFHEMDVSRQQSILSPQESLDRVRNTMAQSLVLNDWVQYNTNKWMKTYGSYVTDRDFPWSGEIKLKPELIGNPEAEAELAMAKLVRQRIQLTTGAHDLQVGEKVQNYLLLFGEYLSRLSVNASKRGEAGLLRNMKVESLNLASSAATKLSGANAVVKAKALAHLSFIIANPLRQLVMQSASSFMYVGLEHGTKYMASTAAARDLSFFMAAKIFQESPEALKTIIQRYSKVAGISEKDAAKMWNDFADGGTLESISGHQFTEFAFSAGGNFRNHAGTYAGKETPNLFTRTRHSTKGVLDTAVRTSSKTGFEAGEAINRMSAYLAVRNKHIVNGTIATMDTTDLATEALRVSGNMGSFSKAAFQEGALGLPFQFMSHTTRMLSYMLPHTKLTSWVSSKTFSEKEKAKIGAFQAVMFGTKGVGLGTLFTQLASDNGIEIDPLLQEGLEGGLYEMGLEALVKGATGTEADVDISGVMGPLSGITGDLQVLFGDGEKAATPIGQMYRVAVDMAIGAPTGFDDFLGAGGAVIGKSAGIAGNIHRIWLNPILGTGEKLEAQIRDLAKLIPALHNVAQARVMANLGQYVTQYGTPIAQVSLADAVFKGALGIQNENVNNIMDTNAAVRGSSTTYVQPTLKETSRTGKEMATHTWNILVQNSNGTISKEEAMDRMESYNAMINLMYEDATDRDIYRAAFNKELVRLAGDRETMADKLTNIIATDLELSHEMGSRRLLNTVKSFGGSPYQDMVVDYIENKMKEGEVN